MRPFWPIFAQIPPFGLKMVKKLFFVKILDFDPKTPIMTKNELVNAIIEETNHLQVKALLL